MLFHIFKQNTIMFGGKKPIPAAHDSIALVAEHGAPSIKKIVLYIII